MKYVIYSYDKSQLAGQDSNLGHLLDSRLPKLASYFSHYTIAPKLEIRIYHSGEHVKLSYLINMRSKPVYVYEQGKNISVLAKELFRRLELRIAKQADFECQQFLKSRKKWQEEGLKEHLDSLDKFKTEDGKTLFVHLLQSLMPDIKSHIRKRIRHELVVRELPPATIDQEDLLSEFYLRVFENFDKKPADREKVTEWLYDEANGLLREKLALIDKGAAHGFVPYEDLVRAKAREMDEQFTVDAEGELLMLEDLDDYAPQYMVDDIEDESGYNEELQEEKMQSAAGT